MHLQVVYCNHHTADLSVREKLAFATETQVQRAYEALRNRFPTSEMVVVSTCNRVEVYTAQEGTGPTPSRDDIAQFFSEFHNVPLDVFTDDLLRHAGPEAVRHLFQVSCSLDSMVLGEPQIVNQVKEAYRRAQENDACGPLTCALFEGAIRVSKRVRSETGVERGRVSIASVAVGDFGKSIFDRFDDKLVLIVGAGEMAEETLRYLKDEGVREVVVINRNPERAAKLAETWGGSAAGMDELHTWMAKADVIVSTTGADRPIMDVPTFRQIREQSDGKPVFILDLGAPRDFEPEIGGLDENVFLYDIDHLEATCERNRNTRAKEIEKAERIVQDETEKFMHNIYHRATGPIIQRLREEWHAIRQQEVDLLLGKLPHLGEADQQAIEKTVERIINKLLHPPLSVLKDEAKAGPPDGLLNALKRLFHLTE
ncbi:glutamyl-tRNA reductase [Thalassoroseus pseudoceratinae]|uniref:glutamyl-tRNA reductase n=1 Tax=Thalassoroseus pseudoceratinae TaxID=2713176 RepID=UPI001423512C|nr:glutamyl-tRNA reductase [Thalassoroseus pseudoceratinae]